MPICRIGAAALVRLFDREGRLLLLRNHAFAKKGITRYSPLGGGIALDKTSIELFKENFQVSEFQSGDDLRVKVDTKYIPDIVEWFQRRTGRYVGTMV